jgi:hypothetical protein
MNTTNAQLPIISVSPGKITGLAVGKWGFMVSTVAPNRGNHDNRMFKMLDELLSALPAARLVVTLPKRAGTSKGRRSRASEQAALLDWAKQRRLECYGVRLPDVRKRFVGNGNASDEMMTAEAKRRGFASANAAESIAIATFHVSLTESARDKDFLSPIAAFHSPLVRLN